MPNRHYKDYNGERQVEQEPLFHNVLASIMFIDQAFAFREGLNLV